jgi:hypothetical protein
MDRMYRETSEVLWKEMTEERQEEYQRAGYDAWAIGSSPQEEEAWRAWAAAPIPNTWDQEPEEWGTPVEDLPSEPEWNVTGWGYEPVVANNDWSSSEEELSSWHDYEVQMESLSLVDTYVPER